MELYEYLREHEIPLKVAAEAIGVKQVTLKKYMTHEREPRLETVLRILKVFDGAVQIEDLLNVRVNHLCLRKINLNNLPKSKKWRRVKAIQAVCRVKSDKVKFEKKYVRLDYKVPEKWFLPANEKTEENENLDFL